MKINEVEELLNTPRANIRYYEKEGLINVSRKENGYRNYTEEDIARLKIGIGPQPNLPSEVFVLQNFSKEELETLKGTLSTAKTAIECYFKEGIAVAQNKFN